MDKERDQFQEENEFHEVLGRFEKMIEHKRSSFFDVYDFERIIDHYLDRNHFSQAISAVGLAMRQHPGSATLLIKEAQVYAEQGEPQKALKMVLSIEKQEESNVELYMLKGMILNQMSRLGEAEKSFNKALEYSYENEVDILYDIALSFEYVNQFRLAIRYLQKASKKKPKRLNVLYELAYCYDRLHDFDMSIQYYEAYLDREPFSENIWYNLGLIYFKKENYRKAIECYDFAIAINDEYAMAVFNKANALANLEDYSGAIKTYKECILLEPDNAMAHCYIAESMEKLENYDGAIEWYIKTTKIDSSFSEAWYGISVCYLFSKLYEDALYYAKKAISLDRENPDFWFTLGNIHANMDSYSDAVKAFKRTIEIDPYDDEAWINLAKLEYQQGQIEKAIFILEESYIHTFDIHTINYSLSAYHYLSGNLEEAGKFFEKGLKLDYSSHIIAKKISPKILEEKSIQRILDRLDPKNIP
jgi:tetratricopeptide (TPR) repeat protein